LFIGKEPQTLSMIELNTQVICKDLFIAKSQQTYLAGT